MQKKMPMRATENISVFYKKLPTYNPQMRGGNRMIKESERRIAQQIMEILEKLLLVTLTGIDILLMS